MKTLKAYRLSPGTLTQIDWLSRRLNLIATDIVQLAISQIHQIEQVKLPENEIIEVVLKDAIQRVFKSQQ
jgi:hypothetical protein